MNRDEAKVILQSFRPGSADATDPYFAEALSMVRQDAELAEWFAKEQAFDTRVSSSLLQVRVPSRLKAEILAGAKSEKSTLFELWQQWFAWRSPVAWTMASVVLVVLGVVLFSERMHVPSGFAAFSMQMVNVALHDPRHVDMKTNALEPALAWLSAHDGESRITLPVSLNGDKGLTGCRVLDWQGQKVSMLCYMINGNGHVDLFVTLANAFPDAPPVDQPRFAMTGGAPTASWTHDGKVYLAISHGGQDILKSLFAQAARFQARRPSFPMLPDAEL